MVNALRGLLLLVCAAGAPSRTLLLSLDGLGHHILTKDPAAAELRSLHSLGRAGTLLPLRPAFPSKTSAGHAAIFTGTWAGVNGVYSNTNPKAPRGAHRLDDTITGFRSESLQATPVWTRAAERGVRAVAYQPTQAYPFTRLSAGLGLPQPPVVVNGYQTRMLAPHGVTRTAGEWRDGRLTFLVERVGRDRVRVRFGAQSVMVSVRGGFSPMLPIEFEGVRTGAYFRLFAADEAGILLYRTSVHEHGVSGTDGAALLAGAGAFIGNSPTALYRRGDFGPLVHAGGDGVAERRYLECFRLVERQMTRQMLWLDRRHRPELFVGYYPLPDDLEHVFYGLSRTGHPEVDATRREAYAILDRGLRALFARFKTVVTVSDHGMAPATHAVHMGVLLESIGFGEGRARANASCVFLNTSDWKDGVIPVAEAPAEREKLASALAAHPLITRVYRFAELAAYGLTGDRAPDACFDVVPLHDPLEKRDGPLTVAFNHAQGEHGFDPNREDMKAILVTTIRGARATTLAEVLGLIGY